MGTPLDIAFVVVGIAVLYWGAEWLIRGSAALARRFGVSQLVVGLTVVAYGNSAPELAVATKTALTNHPAISLGTVIGSCAANISLVLGLTALLAPPSIDGRVIRREIPVLLGSAVAVPLLVWNGVLSRLEGMLLVGCAIVFTILTLALAARGEREASEEDVAAAGDLGGRARPRSSRLAAIAMLAVGIVLLVAGTDMFVRGARGLAAEAGMSERMLGLTVVALGCSLPELIGTVIAASRGHAALAIGAVVGSNLLNVFLVLGVTGYLQPLYLSKPMHVVELFGLVAITLLAIATLRGARRITRFEGAVFVAAYIAFVVTSALM